MNRKVRHQTTIRLNEQVNRILDSKAKDLEISRNAVINMILKKVFSGQPIHI
jgi:predicted HicB family RNase H-like nuclease